MNNCEHGIVMPKTGRCPICEMTRAVETATAVIRALKTKLDGANVETLRLEHALDRMEEEWQTDVTTMEQLAQELDDAKEASGA